MPNMLQDRCVKNLSSTLTAKWEQIVLLFKWDIKKIER